MMRAFFLWLRRKRGKFPVLNSNTNNDISEELKNSSENSSTGKNTNLWVGVIKKCAILI
jgi:hypothetical protein